jgi:hypothetical protein
MIQNGPRRQGYAPENLFKSGKDFLPPRTNRAPLTAAGRSEEPTVIRESGQMQSQNQCSFAAFDRLPLVGPEFLISNRKEAPRRIASLPAFRLILQ